MGSFRGTDFFTFSAVAPTVPRPSLGRNLREIMFSIAPPAIEGFHDPVLTTLTERCDARLDHAPTSPVARITQASQMAFTVGASWSFRMEFPTFASGAATAKS